MQHSIQLTLLSAGTFKLDGGAMFGIVPRRLWARQQPPDANNLCTWALRCLLIETEDRKILVDCGIGTKQDEKWRSYFEPTAAHSLADGLSERGLGIADITDVFLTHLHFDHCGGALVRLASGELVPAFPHATYWSTPSHWEAALHPNEKEAASFLSENFSTLADRGKVRWIAEQPGLVPWLPGIHIQFVYGHTQAMMLLHIRTAKGYFVHCADLLPSSFHVPMPWVMAYDVRPLQTLVEKRELLASAAEGNWYLLLEHDPEHACITIRRDEKGRFVVREKYRDIPGDS
ncbi:MAG: hypothetical protein RLY31_2926 [Bacteroidota bacterium]|jgi:glyoxylase-like metal-dependent hydrolase (beta-lactamase superfamily II)